MATATGTRKVSTKSGNGTASAAKKAAGLKKPAAKKQPSKFTYLPPVDPAMQKMGSVELLAHSEKGEAQCISAALEMLRRKRNRALKSAQAQA